MFNPPPLPAGPRRHRGSGTPPAAQRLRAAVLSVFARRRFGISLRLHQRGAMDAARTGAGCAECARNGQVGSRDRRGASGTSCARGRRPPLRSGGTRFTRRSRGSSPRATTSTAFMPAARSAPSAAPVPRPRRAPPTDRLRFAYASCQHYEQGSYCAYRHMAAEDLDLVIHPRRLHLRVLVGPQSRAQATARTSRSRSRSTATRYALYKSDPDLQAAHAAFPWLVTWDDHEVDNDYAEDRSQDRDLPRGFPAPPRRGLPGLLRAHAAAAAHAARGPRHGDLHPRRLRRAGPVPRARRPPVPLAAGLPAAGARWQQHGARRRTAPSCSIRRAPCSAPRRSAGWTRGSRARRALERDRPADAHGPDRPHARPRASFWTDGWDGYPAARARLLESLAPADAWRIRW